VFILFYIVKYILLPVIIFYLLFLRYSLFGKLFLKKPQNFLIKTALKMDFIGLIKGLSIFTPFNLLKSITTNLTSEFNKQIK